MVFKAVFLLIFIMKTSSGGANETCSETKCNLSIQNGSDLVVEFRSKSSEHGVRMVYLHLNIGNGSYNPLQSYDRLMPNRWTWARVISEPMLSFSYQYEVLSLGLLRNQVRNVEVVLNEEPSGCLAELTSYCKDVVIARTLFDKVTDPSSILLHSANVVCVSVVKRGMDWLTAWYYGNVEYHCCNKNKRGNETSMQCDLPVQYSDWLRVFYHELNFGVIAAYLFWPAALLLLPDFVFMLENEPETNDNPQQNQKSSFLENGSSCDKHPVGSVEIPVDDESPVTCLTFINQCCEEHCPKTSNFFKLFCIYYILMPILSYVYLGLHYIFLSDFLMEMEAKQAIQESVLFYYFFDVRGKLYCLIPVVIFFFILPGNVIFFAAYNAITKIKNFQEKLRSNVQRLPYEIGAPQCIKRNLPKHNINNRFFGPNSIIRSFFKYLNNKSASDYTSKPFKIPSQLFKILLHILFPIIIIIYAVMLALGVVYGLVFGVILFLSFLVRSVERTIYFSPFASLLRFKFDILKTYLSKTKWKWFWMSILAPWTLYFSLAVSLCCRFFMRMFGFVITGLIINAQKAIPYAIFVYVLISNITTSYKNFQNRFKEIKKLIFKYYASSLRNAHDNYKRETIPQQLFWDICNKESEILPFRRELCSMLISILIISSTLFLALTSIVFFGEEYNSSPLITAAAVLLSGKIPDLILKGFIKGGNFEGWEKIHKEERIKEEVENWLKNRRKKGKVQEQDSVRTSDIARQQQGEDGSGRGCHTTSELFGCALIAMEISNMHQNETGVPNEEIT